jgi:hypothetical protein
MVVAIGKCEDDAYPHGKGATLMLEYLTAAIREARKNKWKVDWDALDKRFNIRDRCEDWNDSAA